MDCSQPHTLSYFSLHRHAAGISAITSDQLPQNFLKIWAQGQYLVS